MAAHLLMNLEGPLMSFGGSAVDQRPESLPIPTRSMLAGLIANALGLDRSQGKVINAIQHSMEVAYGVVRRGQQMVDFQTTDLTKPHMVGKMWMRNGRVFERDGSASALQRQMRYAPYWADAKILVAVRFREGSPVDELAALEALNTPARPLFLGRACNIPAAPIGLSVVEADDHLLALEQAGEAFEEVWSPSASHEAFGRFVDLPELKDFTQNYHRGETRYWRVS